MAARPIEDQPDKAGAIGRPTSGTRGTTRRPTVTARFGSSRRENHDSSLFYERFVPPELTRDETVARPAAVDLVYNDDARDMGLVASNSVALVVTSPPYFAGKEYEASLGHNGVPGSYFEYLSLLRDVFAECKRVLEPGGRIAVNVANLGRRPYRSLASDVVTILEELGLLLRGEVIWWKGRAAGGSCAWGTFQRPGNPVLRDVTERLVIASKGRFDRALSPEQRHARGLPSAASISRDEFLEATTDLWELPPERATRVGHPAPFPVELPTRVIELYTYVGDMVLDPFIGSGSTAVAALRTRRHFIGFDTDKSYVEAARERIAEERERLQHRESRAIPPLRVELSVAPDDADGEGSFESAVRQGRQAKEIARVLLERCGFRNLRADVKVPGLGLELSLVATDQTGADWAFDVSGAFTVARAGLRRNDTLWRAVGKAAVLREAGGAMPLVVLTTDAPPKHSAAHAALAVLTGPERPILDVVELLDTAGHRRLRQYAANGRGLLA